MPLEPIEEARAFHLLGQFLMEALLTSNISFRSIGPRERASTTAPSEILSRQTSCATRMMSDAGSYGTSGSDIRREPGVSPNSPDLPVSDSSSRPPPKSEDHPRKRILFVDDEKSVLLVLQAFMQRLSSEWDAVCVESGPQALALMAQQPFDVIITDMRMPDMTGTELLNEVMKRYPRTVRIVLSGHADEQTVQDSVGVAHQWIAKPFDLKVLRSVLSLIASFHRRLEAPGIRELIGKIQHLPSAPQLYFEIIEALQSSTASIQTIAEIIGRDLSLTANILHLVNSAFFGCARSICDPNEAVQLLGVSRIRSLALIHHVFSSFDRRSYDELSVDEVWQHSLQTASWARQFVMWQGGGRMMEERAFTGGLLHDIGQLILAANLPTAYCEIRKLARSRKIPVYEAEQLVLKATHADVGAYLLSIWGLPIPLVETIALHHEPARAPDRTFSALAAVHLASAWSYEQTPSAREIPGSPLDMEYLAEVGVADQLVLWRQRLAHHY
jgi:HD-like signal output (HDOD) protein